ARPRLPALLQELKGQFDYVVLDSAPVLPVVDSLLIGQHVDGVVFSLLRGVSQLPLAQEGYRRLADIGVRLLGAVVSGAPVVGQAYRSLDSGMVGPGNGPVAPEQTAERGEK